MVETGKERTVLIIHETAREGLIRDSGTVAAFMALIIPGWWIGSDALQWIGALLGLFWVTAKAGNFARGNTMTVAQARKRLDQIEKEAAHG